MVEPVAVTALSRLSLWLSGVFAVIGIGMMFLYIGVTEASMPMKILWSGTLSLGVAMTFLVAWVIARDVVRDKERETKRKQVP
jgi:hypothetical protein